MKQIVLMSRRPGTKNFGIRNRLTEENYLYRSGKMTAEDVIEAAVTKGNLWSMTEPQTEFKVDVIDGKERTQPTTRVLPSGATALGDPIAQLQGSGRGRDGRPAGHEGESPAANSGSIPANGFKRGGGRRAKGPGNGEPRDQLDNPAGS